MKLRASRNNTIKKDEKKERLILIKYFHTYFNALIMHENKINRIDSI